MALPPHWLDEVIGDSLDPGAIATAIGSSPKLKDIAKIAVDRAKLAEDEREQAPRPIMGPGIRQIIRQAILAGLIDPQGRVPDRRPDAG